MEQIFDSDKFFEVVQFNGDLINAFESEEDREDGLFNSYNWILLTKGNDKNLQKKYEFIFSDKCPFFKRNKDKIGYYGLNLHENKKTVHMLSGIQIDDNYYNLRDTDADLKILLKNGIETNYNMIYKTSDNLQNLYITDNMIQVIEILKFIRQMDNEGIDILEDMEIGVGELFDY